ncbi:MAG: DEAD/DEAH box helicase family protein [Anaerolineae bacterium]|nr:DEAD/DEAH box helicase family protein [Anaerolineae bacterium]
MANNSLSEYAASMKKSNNPRLTYLLDTLELSHDPFAGPVAEQELRSSEKQPHFFAYYTDPHDPKFNKPLPQALREARNGLIFGRPGSGKTTLRYTLEAECRSVYDRTLVVTYELSHKPTQQLTAEQHWTNIAKELALDLFIQVLEQLDALEPPTETQKKQWQAQLALVWSRLWRTAELILTDDFTDRENGLASLWSRLNRPAVRYIKPSLKIVNLLKDCWLPETETVSPPPGSDASLTGAELLQTGLLAAKSWGFRQIFVLVDGVDAYEREIDKILGLITPLFDHLARWQSQGLFFYFFLPEEMQTPIFKTYENIFNSLSYPPLSYLIHWDDAALAELLRQRLRAAGSHIPGFNYLAAAELAGTLEEKLIQAAQHSPRHLLRLVSALIDAHAQHAPDQPLLTAADWRRMKQFWSYDSPLPE